VLAADHVIRKPEEFRAVCRSAASAAAERRIVTFGIEPTGPVTSYGYIRPGKKLNGASARVVEAFVEKPDAATAATYVADRRSLHFARRAPGGKRKRSQRLDGAGQRQSMDDSVTRAHDERKLISVLIPVYNEESNLVAAYEEVRDVFEALSERYLLEIIFADNHSTDNSFALISQLAERDRRVRAVRFARNFGFQRSVLTCYRLASGDAAIQLDCDLQDPPSLFPKFLELWEQGHDVVVGIRRFRDEGRLLQWVRRIYYRLLRRVSNDNLVLDSGDFRLVDRTILDQLHHINDANPYTRGLTSMLAAKQTGFRYDRQKRRSGKSKFPIPKLMALAVDGLITHSVFPLRLAAYIGLGVSVVACLASFGYLFARLFFGIYWPPGFATTTVLLLFGISLNGIFLGIIGEYVGRIYNQVRSRPTTVIERWINLPEAGGASVISRPPAGCLARPVVSDQIVVVNRDWEHKTR
jgi:dolichol-phosphate mannosyltransferase